MRSFGRYLRETEDDEQHRYGHRASHLSWGRGDVELYDPSGNPIIEDVHAPDGIDYRLIPAGHPDAREYPIEHEHHPEELARHARWREKMDPVHWMSVNEYKDSSYELNKKLRNQGNHLTDHGWSRIGLGNHHPFAESMDHITSLPQSHPVNLYRGFGSDFPIHHLKTGSEFVDHGYTGGSLNMLTALNASHQHESDPTKLTDLDQEKYMVPRGHPLEGYRTIGLIHSPAGTKGHYLDHPDYPNIYDNEQEHLLGRGTRFRVGGHVLLPDHKVHVVHLHVVGQEPKEITRE